MAAATKSVLRRSLLYVPGSSPWMLQKSRLLKADCIAYDLEDNVTLSQKLIARQQIREVLSLPRADGIREQAVRINAMETGLALGDLTEILKAEHVDAIVVPKVNKASDLASVASAIASSGHTNAANIRLIALIESARAVMDIRTICESAPKLSGLVFAAEDFSLDLSLTRSPGLTEFLFARQTIVAAARAYDLDGGAMDLACIDYKNTTDAGPLVRECVDGAGMGFAGKQCIHPSQTEVVERIFAPDVEKVRAAIRLLCAKRRADEQEIGGWTLDGKIVGSPAIEAAKKVVGKAQLAGIEMAQFWQKYKNIIPE